LRYRLKRCAPKSSECLKKSRLLLTMESAAWNGPQLLIPEADMAMLPSKDIRKEIVEDGTGFFRLLQTVPRLTETQTKHGAKIEKQERQIELLKDSVRTLEAREEFLLARLDAALTQAAAA
jgi:hypothetical protein